MKKPFEKSGPGHRFTGWRKGGLVNTLVLIVVTTILLGFLITAVVHAGGLRRSFVFLRTDCDSAQRIDVGIHLLLNAFSTALLASSNFFMQVLNAPSRSKVDKAHANGRFLHIGVSSWRNALATFGWKTAAWAVLVLSSIPIHLVFNSAVFVTDQRASRYYLTIASEGFLHGDPFFPPGASLSPSGLYHLSNMNVKYGEYPDDAYRDIGYSFRFSPSSGAVREIGTPESNFTLSFPNSTDRAQPTWRNLTHAATNGAGWVRLDRETCTKEYITCHGLRDYGALVVVIDRKGMSWARNDLWDLNDTSSQMWDEMIPANQDNSLWYSALCRMKGIVSQSKTEIKTGCRNTCFQALGVSPEAAPDSVISGGVPDWETIDFFPRAGDIDRDVAKSWDTDEAATENSPWPWASRNNQTSFGLRPGRGQLSVDYCLAEPLVQQCGVGISNMLFFVVVLCASAKAITCVAVMSTIRDQNLLVTLGDAVESFIVKPDTSAVGPDRSIHGGTSYSQVAVSAPVQSRSTSKRAHMAISRKIWFLGSLPLVAGILGCIILINVQPGTLDAATLAGLFSSNSHDVDYGGDTVIDEGTNEALIMVLGANSPQILLSLWYLVYNQTMTCLVVAKEWAHFSTTFQPLRVTYPRGRQVSTYFLGLPYRYSIPMITVSIIIHWLLSRSLYVFVAEGEYFSNRSGGRDMDLPKGSVQNLRFSTATFLLLVSICSLMALVLVGLSFRRLPGYMPIVGTNSQRIAAACHVSPLSRPWNQKSREAERTETETDNEELSIAPEIVTTANTERLLVHAMGSMIKMSGATTTRQQHRQDGYSDDDDETGYQNLDPDTIRLTKVSQDFLSWGIVRMPAEWYAEKMALIMDERATGASAGGPPPQEFELVRMSFGTPVDNVRPPKDRSWYIFK